MSVWYVTEWEEGVGHHYCQVTLRSTDQALGVKVDDGVCYDVSIVPL